MDDALALALAGTSGDADADAALVTAFELPGLEVSLAATVAEIVIEALPVAVADSELEATGATVSDILRLGVGADVSCPAVPDVNSKSSTARVTVLKAGKVLGTTVAILRIAGR